MKKPDWTYEPIPKDVFPPRVQEALEALREKMDEIEGEELKIVMEGAYLEGLLDGFRVMDYIQRNFF
ncbi:MAG: hypothetical protein E7299_03485 [Lachnospiraceae bacterium]|nr:hypothetical protein [Lachnospiraceae bacterium]